jgi:hypothetical protein
MDTMMNPDDPLERFVAAPDDFIQKAAEPLVAARTADLQRQLTAMQGQLSRERVERTLDGDPALSRWRQVNHDPGFLAWLDQVDELAGEKRLELLRRAYHYGNADVVANIFKGWIIGKLPGRTIQPLPYQNTRRTPAPVDTSRRTWTRPEIARFYEDVRRGRYADRESEKLRIERDILAAASERRVSNPPLQLFSK